MHRCTHCGGAYQHGPTPICRGAEGATDPLRESGDQDARSAPQEPAWEVVPPADLNGGYAASGPYLAAHPYAERARSVGQALLDVMERARRYADGHFTIFGFTTNVRAALGTPELIATDWTPYFQVQAAPKAPTVLEALEHLFHNPVKFSELDADAERARLDRDVAGIIAAVGGVRIVVPPREQVLQQLDEQMELLDREIDAISDPTVWDLVNRRVGNVRDLVDRARRCRA